MNKEYHINIDTVTLDKFFIFRKDDKKAILRYNMYPDEMANDPNTFNSIKMQNSQENQEFLSLPLMFSSREKAEEYINQMTNDIKHIDKAAVAQVKDVTANFDSNCFLCE